MTEATSSALSAAFSREAGGKIWFVINCEKSTVRVLCITAVSLYGIYQATPLLARAIDGIVNRGLGGPREDQGKIQKKPSQVLIRLAY